MDLTDLQYNAQLYQLVIGPLKSLAEFMAEHYVELVKYFVLVNVPSFVYALWTVVKPLLPERTRSKVRILSSSNWRTEILEYACKESLPINWNNSDQNIFASDVPVPLKFSKLDYYKNAIAEVPEGVEKVKIPAGKISFITQQLKATDQLNFWVQADMDFGFGIFRTDDDKQEDIAEMDTIYPCFGWIPGPTVVPLHESVTVSEPGLYKIYLSNAKAWWNTLTVQILLTSEKMI